MDKYTQIWTQSNCLSKTQLLHYIQQKLDRDEVYLVESHLNDCALCADALDGLMEEDIAQTEQIIAEIKADIEKQIKLKHPTEANNAGLTLNTKHDVRKSINTIEKKANNKYRWLVAASILLVVGLGGYTVYSFIHSHNTELAQQKEGSSSTDANYNKPEDVNANEITTLRVETPDGAIVNDASQALKKEKAVSDSKYIEPRIGEKKELNPVSDIAKKEKLMESEAAPPMAQEAEKPKDYDRAKQAKDEEIKSAPEMSNYLNDKISETPTKAIVSKKKSSSGGLSNSKPEYKQNSGEKAYPASQNNNRNTVQLSSNESISGNASTKTISDYDQAMQLYNAGDYKKSISYFEDALNTATVSNKEDIQYQLAQAYIKAGKERKARKLLELLAKGTKYQKEAETELQKTKSAK